MDTLTEEEQRVLIVLASALLVSGLELTESTFRGPLFLRTSLERSSHTASGDLNGDGRLDLLVTGYGTSIEALVQDPSDRSSWTSKLSRAGGSAYHVEIADFDRDGFHDAVVSDTAASPLLLRGKGDGSFSEPDAIDAQQPARWSASGDWDGDDNLDLAVATRERLAILFGEGNGSFARRSQVSIKAHAVEPLDMDGDGVTDLVAASVTGELVALRGDGRGSFEILPPTIPPCESPGGNIVSVGDMDGDGKSDVAVFCDGDLSMAGVGVKVLLFRSRGNGSFLASGEISAPSSAPPVVEDVDRDGISDVITADPVTNMVLIHPGRGDGTVAAGIPFGPTGSNPVSLLVADLDGDGRLDLTAADAGSQTVTILWGMEGDRLFETVPMATGYQATSAATADVDGDGQLDFVFNRAGAAGIDFYLGPADRSRDVPSASISTKVAYWALISSDLDGNGQPDIAGTNVAEDTVMVTLRDINGGAAREESYGVGTYPSALVAGQLEGDESTDLIVLCRGSSELAVLEGVGQGMFAAPRMHATLSRPNDLALADLDADGKTDVVVAAALEVAVHFGGNPELEERSLLLDGNGLMSNLVCGEFTGDGVDDILVNRRNPPMLLLLHGSRSRSFAAPEQIPLSFSPILVETSYADEDSLRDILLADAAGNTFLLLSRDSFREGQQVLLPRILDKPLALQLRDFNADGVHDFTVLGSRRSYIFAGIADESVFTLRRGDSDSSGDVNMTDPVALLVHLFQGGAISCGDAADANDDGSLTLTDAVVTLEWLFRGGQPPLAPGPFACGSDPTVDALGSCQACVP